MLRAFIFDFDGIIADTETLHFLTYLPMLEEAGIAFSYEEYGERYMAYDALGCFRQRAEDAGHPVGEATLHNWVERKNGIFEEVAARAAPPPLPGAVEAVTLAAQHGPVAICTGATRRDIDPLVERYGLRPLLATVVTADDVAISKPDPESYTLAAKRLGIPPAECLAIEDTPGGLRSARGAGCQTLGVTTTHDREALAPTADDILTSLEEFPAWLKSCVAMDPKGGLHPQPKRPRTTDGFDQPRMLFLDELKYPINDFIASERSVVGRSHPWVL